MRRLQYYIVVLGTSSALALTGCSTLPSDYVTADGDACQAPRADMKAVDDYFNQSLIQGTALGAAALVVAVATTVTVLAARAADKHVPAAPGTTTYALPSNGWTPGAATMQVAFGGPFHAVLVGATFWFLWLA